MKLVRSAALAFAVVSMLTACGSVRELDQATNAEGCANCHEVPPATGAHLAHLGSTVSPAIACESCHVVPDDLRHSDGRVVVSFSAFARQGVADPGYDAASGTCAVYCHGSTDGLGNGTSPAWTSTGLACNGCHDTAQDSNQASGYHQFHVQARQVPCEACHRGYRIGPSPVVNLANHLNGTFDASPINTTASYSSWPLECNACHTF